MGERLQIFAYLGKGKRRELTINTSDLGRVTVPADVAFSVLIAHEAQQITEAEVGEILLAARDRRRER